MKSKIAPLIAAWSLGSSGLFAAALVVNIDSGGLDVQSLNGASLTAGGPNVPYDGAVIQLGYFSGATSDGSNFVGEFRPLTGEGSANFAQNTKFDTTIGDDFTQGFGPPFEGQFQISLVFDTALHTNLPAPGTVLAIRIFDSTTISSSINFLTISSNLWKWKAPGSLTDPNARVDISFADAGLRLENRAAGSTSSPDGSPVGANLRTTVPVPEPTSAVLGILGAGALLMRRRQR